MIAGSGENAARRLVGRTALGMATLVLLLAPRVASSVPISNLTITTHTVGSGQTFQNVQAGQRSALIHGSVSLPKGDPFSSASITFEFDLVGVSGSGQPTNRPAIVQLFGTLAGVDDAEVEAIGGGPVPWDLELALVRLGPDPEVIFFGNESDTQTSDPNDAFEWHDEGYALAAGRYRYSIQASQVGGAIKAAVGSTLFVNPIPEPGAAVAYGTGLVLLARFTNSRRRARRPKLSRRG